MKPDLIIFGGSFDPPHQGHKEGADLLKTAFPDAKIKIVPAFSPAGASGKHKTPLASFSRRIELCKLVFADLDVTDLEAELPKPNFTLRTLSEIAAMHPVNKLGLLLGQDQIDSFDRWQDPRSILETASLIAMPRKPQREPLETTIKNLLSRMEIPYQEEGHAFALTGFSHNIYTLPEGPASPAESLKVREYLANNEAPPKGWLEKGVLDYITEHKLYRD